MNNKRLQNIIESAYVLVDYRTPRIERSHDSAEDTNNEEKEEL